MSKKIYVGNLPFRATEEELSGLFSEIGAVESVSIITDRDTGRSKGFGFVSMSDDDADKAIAALNGKDFAGRALTVNEARPMVKKEFTSRAGRSNRW
jgi:RNA recognition motif-containing protein